MRAKERTRAAEARQDKVETVDAAGLTDRERTELREALLNEREAIRARAQGRLELVQEAEPELADEMDRASRDQEQGLVLRIADKERKLLSQVEAALAKFEEGSYGLCEGTDEPIGYARLKARPWARHSAAYKEQLEREERLAKFYRR